MVYAIRSHHCFAKLSGMRGSSAWHHDGRWWLEDAVGDEPTSGEVVGNWNSAIDTQVLSATLITS